MNTFLNRSNFIFNQKKRIQFAHNEIFFITGSIFKQIKYSKNLHYFLFKRRTLGILLTKLKNRCVVSNSSRGVHSKFRLSRIQLSKKISFGSVPGFFHSV